MDRDIYAKVIAKLQEAEGLLSGLEGKIVTVSGTMGDTADTYVTVDFPEGLTGENCAVIGHMEQNSGGNWYSNNPSITVITDNINKIRVKSSEASFLEQSFKVLLCKI